ncbi:MAG: TPM domain-containing protein [Dysgonamonadaceae bacterium]|nr:TPM domain-containing protein [Dysgonamonadaceae bacterium]MDD4728589.1 TPM domain-containing protein [Dysgonamonadaceae bacterium]
MKLFWRISQKLILFLFLTQNIIAQNIPEPMSPPQLVNDFANIFSDVEKQTLESKLRIYNDTTSTQIYVVTVTDLDGYAASDYSFRLGEKWQIGQKTKDNGAVILVKPKVGNSRGEAFIAVGYGLEARINDAYAGRIVRNRMIPYFKNDDYFSGVNIAIDTMIKRLSGEFDPDMEDSEEAPSGFIIIMFIIFFIVFVLTISKKGGGDQNIGGDGSNRSSRGPIFFPPIMGGSRGGSFGGGGFGGGFGGGGGGRFGGGGAGGSW